MPVLKVPGVGFSKVIMETSRTKTGTQKRRKRKWRPDTRGAFSLALLLVAALVLVAFLWNYFPEFTISFVILLCLLALGLGAALYVWHLNREDAPISNTIKSRGAEPR